MIRSRGIFVIGIVLFATLLIITYATPIVSEEDYSYIRFWLLHYPYKNSNNPILAPPTFINIFSSKKYALTTDLYLDYTKVFSYGSYQVIEGYINYTLNADVPPRNFIVEVELNFSGTPGIKIIKVLLIRPDNITLKGFVESVEDQSEHYIIKLTSSNFYESLRREYLKRGYKEAIKNLSEFAKPEAIFMNETFYSLKGEYKFLIKILFLNSNDLSKNVFENVHVRILGSCHGIMGTDFLGRDVFITVMEAGRQTITVAIFTALISSTIGLVLGAYAGSVDNIISKTLRVIIDSVNSLPYIPLIAIFIWSIGSTFSTSVQVPWWVLALVISLFLWGRPAKGAVGISSKISQEQFIEASRAMGASNVRVVFKHIFPNILEYYFSSIILSIPRAVLVIALIGIMGVSIGPNIGTYFAQVVSPDTFTARAWWPILFPIIYIGLFGFSVGIIAYYFEENYRKTL